MGTKKPALIFHVEEDFKKEINDYRYEKRIPTEAEATRQLIRLGLDTWKKSKQK